MSCVSSLVSMSLLHWSYVVCRALTLTMFCVSCLAFVLSFVSCLYLVLSLSCFAHWSFFALFVVLSCVFTSPYPLPLTCFVPGPALSCLLFCLVFWPCTCRVSLSRLVFLALASFSFFPQVYLRFFKCLSTLLVLHCLIYCLCRALISLSLSLSLTPTPTPTHTPTPILKPEP